MAKVAIPVRFIAQIYRKIFPEVRTQLLYWEKRAEEIPNRELRKQALASMRQKRFHCQGGAVFALLAGENYREAVRFIVAYQTISDYLDNLCDRSNSQDPGDFAALHEALRHCLSLHAEIPPGSEYYRFRNDKEDGGYLRELVQTCREVLRKTKHYGSMEEELLRLCTLYCALQIHKHAPVSERVPRLRSWFREHKEWASDMDWHEFSACAGSTLGIFSLVSYGLTGKMTPELARKIAEGYFPYIQGFHILLDYLIDQEEDRAGGDLNFCFYYESEEIMLRRLFHFFRMAKLQAGQLPDAAFHQWIVKGLPGLYLSDGKVSRNAGLKRLAKPLIREGGWTGKFFYWQAKLYRLILNRKGKPFS